LRTEGKRAAATEATRRGIIAAARDLLTERQWQDFTVEAVANRAQVTRVTVYNQVKSKAGLLEAVLTELTQQARMDQLLNDTEHLTATDACAAIALRTCRFWHAERAILRPLYSLAGIDPVIGAALAQREGWRREQLRHLLRRLAEQNTLTATIAADDALAAALAVTSFPTYDQLGQLADDPDRASGLITRLLSNLAT
jgi:AcrR family transcriptional regulator